jgi:hypothetical protein
MLIAYSRIDPGRLSGIVGLLQRNLLVRRFYARYRSQRPADAAHVRYYEAYRCLRSLLWSVELRAGDNPDPWDTRRLAAHFRRITGVDINAR